MLVTFSASDAPLRVETLAGEPVELSLRQEDRALLVHFWASWCRECVEELPVLAAATDRCRAAGVRLVSVNVGEDRKTIEAFLAPLDISHPVLRDPRGRTWRRAAGTGLPANVIWTPEGRTADVGPRSASAWAQTLADLGCGAAD